MHTSRRDFIAGLGALALMPYARLEADLIFYNGNIFTVSDKLPHAQAVAISNGRFFAVGSNDEILPLATASTRKIDLGWKTVLPGFNDAHSHPCISGVDHLRMVACDKDSIEAIQAALRERAQKTAPGQWVLGFLYDDGKTPHPINRHDLDAAVPGHPVLIHHRGGHTVFVNSLALKTAGVDDSTPDPTGGRFERDSSGHLTGFVGDAAVRVFDKFIEDNPTRDDYRKGAALISRMFAARGVTSACDADCDPEGVQGYQDARDAGELRFRVYAHIGARFVDRYIAAGIHTGFGDDWVRVGGVKQYADGSISERTAWLSQPYIGISNNYVGLQLSTREQLLETARKVHAAGWQLATHANGDLAIDRILDVYEQVQREMPRRDPRFRIEHCTLPTDSAIQRMRTLGVIPVPFSAYVYFHGDVMHFYGEQRTERMFPMRSYLDAGLRPPDSSDYTASPSDPMMWMQSQVTRTDMKGNVWGANQRITIEEAVRCGTANGAYASFEENTKGSIEPGKLADLVVLGQDPFKADASSLVKIPVERTMLGGKWSYES
ncbi:MAG TPA: amidohydrolase [Candidatus Acidoferrum sp.]|nr:amidohydrolase [Candidatus Acidoferrum sp.]